MLQLRNEKLYFCTVLKIKLFNYLKPNQHTDHISFLLLSLTGNVENHKKYS